MTGRLCAVLAVCAFISSAAWSLELRVPEELQPAWGRLVAVHPVPERIAEGSIIITAGSVPGFKVVERSIMAAVARLWDEQATIPLTRARAESAAVRLVPAESVTLPDIVLPVDGLYPGDEGYSLTGEVAVGIQGGDPMLAHWFESLPSPRTVLFGRIHWIGAVGDVMPARGVDAALRAPGGDQRVFGDTLPVLRGLDLLVGNLEAAATVGGAQSGKTYTFRFDPRAIAILSGAGFSYLSLANNHTFDYGRQGFIDTLANLAQAGVATSGAGLTLHDATEPAVLRRDGVEIRILSFGAYPVDRTGFDGRTMARVTGDRPGMLWLDDEGRAAAVRGFSRDAFNIALVHGGVEWSTVPSAEQKQQYRNLLDAGADLVIGSHPHVLQGLEARGGRLIVYSLGNFLFPGMDGTPGGDHSMILEVGVARGRIVAVRFVPVRLSGITVRLDPGRETVNTLLTRSRILNEHP